MYFYIKSVGVYKCLDDATPGGTDSAGAQTYPLSYGGNVSVATTPLSVLGGVAKSVLLFEAAGSAVNMALVGTATSGDTSSPTADGNPAGWGGGVRDRRDERGDKYGRHDKRQLSKPDGSALGWLQFSAGGWACQHAKWLRGTSVSIGGDDVSGDGTACNTYTNGMANGMSAQTGCSSPLLGATFNTL